MMVTTYPLFGAGAGELRWTRCSQEAIPEGQSQFTLEITLLGYDIDLWKNYAGSMIKYLWGK